MACLIILQLNCSLIILQLNCSPIMRVQALHITKSSIKIYKGPTAIFFSLSPSPPSLSNFFCSDYAAELLIFSEQ